MGRTKTETTSSPTAGRHPQDIRDAEADDLLSQMAGQEIERLLNEAQVEPASVATGGAPAWDVGAHSAHRGTSDASPVADRLAAVPAGSSPAEHDAALAAQIDAVFDELVGEAPLSKKEKRQRAEERLKQATAWATRPEKKKRKEEAPVTQEEPSGEVPDAPALAGGEGETSAAADAPEFPVGAPPAEVSAESLPAEATVEVPDAAAAGNPSVLDEIRYDRNDSPLPEDFPEIEDEPLPEPTEAVVFKDQNPPVNLLAALDALGESDEPDAPVVEGNVTARDATAPPVTDLAEVADEAEGAGGAAKDAPAAVEATPRAPGEAAGLDAQLDALFTALTTEPETPESASPQGAASEQAESPVGGPVDEEESTASAERQLLAEELPASVADVEVAPEPVPAPTQPAAALLAPTPEPAPEASVPARRRRSLLVRVLEIVNAPLAFVGDATRELMGKVAILTLVNALLILLYVVFFRRA